MNRRKSGSFRLRSAGRVTTMPKRAGTPCRSQTLWFVGSSVALERVVVKYSIVFLAGSAIALSAAATPQGSLISAEERDKAAVERSDVTLLREAGIACDGKQLLRFLAQNTGDDQCLLRLNEFVQRLGSDDFDERTRAADRLIRVGFVALSSLRDAAKATKDPEIARQVRDCIQRIETGRNPFHITAAVHELIRQNPDGATASLFQFYPYAADDELQADIAYVFDDLAKKGMRIALLEKGLGDSVPARRALAVCIIGRRGNDQQREAARKLLADTDPLVRLRAAQALLGANDKSGVPTLIALTETGPIYIAWQAEELLHYAAGFDSPAELVAAGDERTRKACRAAWDSWWRETGARVDLARMRREPRRPGLFLGAAGGPADPKQVEGHVYLFGCDGTVRWFLPAMSNPREAHFLADERVLVCEQETVADLPGLERKVLGKARTALFDLRGKVIWENAERAPLAAVMVLPDGRLRGTERQSIYSELAPDGKTLRTIDFGVLAAHAKIDQRFLTPTIKMLTTGKVGVRDDTFSYFAEYNVETGRCGEVVPLQSRFPANAARRVLSPRNGVSLAIPDRFVDGVPPLFQTDATGKILTEVPSRPFPWSKGESVFVAGVLPISCFPLLRVGLDEFDDDHPDATSSYTAISTLLHKGNTSTRLFVLSSVATSDRRLPPELLATLAEIANGSDARIQTAVTLAMAKLDRAAVPGLVALTRNESAGLRRAAVTTLNSTNYAIDSRTILPALLERLRDKDPSVRCYALHSLVSFGLEADGVLAALVSGLADDEVVSGPWSSVAAVALWHFCETLKSPAAARKLLPYLPNIVRTIKSRDPQARISAIYAIGGFGGSASETVPQLIDVIRTARNEVDMEYGARVQIVAASSLGRIGPLAKDALPDLEEAARSKNPELRQEAVQAIRRIKQP
jgi:HEAT repeat protein